MFFIPQLWKIDMSGTRDASFDCDRRKQCDYKEDTLDISRKLHSIFLVHQQDSR